MTDSPRYLLQGGRKTLSKRIHNEQSQFVYNAILWCTHVHNLTNLTSTSKIIILVRLYIPKIFTFSRLKGICGREKNNEVLISS